MKKENKMVKKLIYLLPVLLFVFLFSIFLVSGASTMTSPVSYANYTTSLAIALTIARNGVNNMTNVTCFYNSSGGAVQTFLIQILNDSLSSTSFTGTASLTTQTNTYNISCKIRNQTFDNLTLYAHHVAIDLTAPNVSIATDQSSAYQTKNVGLNWSCTDGVSGVETTSVSLTANGDAGCTLAGTTSWTTATGSQTLTATQTQCAGLYTNTLTCTDQSSNSASTTSTFNIYYPEGGSGVIPIKQKAIIPTKTSPQSNKTLFVIIAIVGLIIISVISFLVISISKKRR